MISMVDRVFRAALPPAATRRNGARSPACGRAEDSRTVITITSARMRRHAVVDDDRVSARWQPARSPIRRGIGIIRGKGATSLLPRASSRPVYTYRPHACCLMATPGAAESLMQQWRGGGNKDKRAGAAHARRQGPRG